MPEWKRSAEPATEDQIRQVEMRSKICLPPRYRNFLLAANGGQPCEYVTFDVVEVGEKVMLGCLYEISDIESGVDLGTMCDEFRDVLPEWCIPIGEDPGGNQLVLAIDGYDIEAIYFWDRVGFFAKRTGKNLFRIAKDIDGFLTALQSESD